MLINVTLYCTFEVIHGSYSILCGMRGNMARTLSTAAYIQGCSCRKQTNKQAILLFWQLEYTINNLHDQASSCANDRRAAVFDLTSCLQGGCLFYTHNSPVHLSSGTMLRIVLHSLNVN